MSRIRFLILGAGPSGLTLAHALRMGGESSFLIIDKEAEPGGLCRSATIDGGPLDTGGGHFLDVARPDVLEFVFRFMPRVEWNEFERDSRVHLYNRYLDHPLEANLWQLDTEDVISILETVVTAGSVLGTPVPEAFDDWIKWKFGERIASDYMLPYNRKIWSLDLRLLGTYWLHKLPDVSFRQMLRACLNRENPRLSPCHAQFLYPKRHGYGEVWRRMGDDLNKSLILGYQIKCLDTRTRTLNDEISYEYLINTIPWPSWLTFAAVPDAVSKAIRSLVATSIDIHYSPQPPVNRSHWVYEPDECLHYHRVLHRANFATGTSGCWTETNSKRTPPSKPADFQNEFAYPVNTRDKSVQLRAINEWARTHNILALGRWGLWEHINSDVSVQRALELSTHLHN